ncbi:hypothetical protein PoB_002991200 [Plakobranchus ocellatus]|uniref:Uncharacterized protein n=1 Tax=Plakobranchus ocellatus TaxID=259542 RepID=A0AAV4A8X7_9GAST|nr:hypothetical protein PoB_002991200 [Plakobranchus ocellatus]
MTVKVMVIKRNDIVKKKSSNVKDDDENEKEEKENEQNASPQQGDLSVLGPPSGQGAVGWARTHDRRVPADRRADS